MKRVFTWCHWMSLISFSPTNLSKQSREYTRKQNLSWRRKMQLYLLLVVTLRHVWSRVHDLRINLTSSYQERKVNIAAKRTAHITAASEFVLIRWQQLSKMENCRNFWYGLGNHSLRKEWILLQPWKRTCQKILVAKAVRNVHQKGLQKSFP